MCGCGGGAAGQPSGGTGWHPIVPGAVYVFEVIYPDGSTERFPTESQAYWAVASGGGGIRQVLSE